MPQEPEKYALTVELLKQLQQQRELERLKDATQPKDSTELFRELLNEAQKRGIEASPFMKEHTRKVGAPWIKDKCLCAEPFGRVGVSDQHDLASTALTGTRNFGIAVTRTGQPVMYDGFFKGISDKHKKQKLLDTVHEVEAVMPRTPEEREKFHQHLENKIPEWNYQADIAEKCGYELVVNVLDKKAHAHIESKLPPDRNWRLRQASIGGQYKKVFNDTVQRPKGSGKNIGEVHHGALGVASTRDAGGMGNGINRDTLPALWLDMDVHKETGDFRSATVKPPNRMKSADQFRAEQSEKIRSGQILQSFDDQVADIHDAAAKAGKKPGLYDDAIYQMNEYLIEESILLQVEENVLNAPQSSLPQDPMALLKWSREAIATVQSRPSSWVHQGNPTLEEVRQGTKELSQSVRNMRDQGVTLRQHRADLMEKYQTSGDRSFRNPFGMSEKEQATNSREISKIDHQLRDLEHDFYFTQSQLQESIQLHDQLQAWEQNPAVQEAQANVGLIQSSPELQQTLLELETQAQAQAQAQQPEPELAAAAAEQMAL